MKDNMNFLQVITPILAFGLVFIVLFSEPKTVEVEPRVCIDVEEKVLGKAEDRFEGVR